MSNCVDRNGMPKRRYLTFEEAQNVADFEKVNRGVLLRVYECEKCFGFHLTNDKKGKNDVDNRNLWRNFYFNNAGFDENKINIIQNNVDRDFDPFLEFLKRSQKNIQNRAEIFAECEEIKNNSKILQLNGELIKLEKNLSLTEIILDLPSENLKIVELKDENFFFDNRDFEIVQGRDTVICDQNSLVYSVEKIIVEVNDKNILENDSYLFWVGKKHSDCYLKNLDEDFYKEFLCSTCKLDIKNLKIQNNKIHIFTKNFNENNDIKSDNLKFYLFDENSKIELKIVEYKKAQFNEKNLYMQNAKIKHIKDDIFLVQPKAFGKLFNQKELIKYNKFNSAAEIFNLLEMSCDKNFDLLNGRIIYKNENDTKNEIEIANVPFKISIEKNQFPHRLKDKNGNYCGTFFELKESENLIDDIHSNIDYFFDESTDILSNEKNAKFQNKNENKSVIFYKVGKTFSNDSIMEICECDKFGKNLKKIDSDKLPSKLYLVPDTNQIQKQIDALQHLKNLPSKFHKSLLDLTDDKNFVHRNDTKSFSNDFENSLLPVEQWYKLTNEDYDGCLEQREFVKIALATPDFAFLDGPPGSGKTTTILEYIAQMVMQGKKVLLAASTNAAVDNILERISDLPETVKNEILAVRLGSENGISETVKQYSLFDYSDEDVKNEIITRANLVCGTIIGILKHPEFNHKQKDLPIVPLYDALIIDEVSKTTFQEFLVPALYAKRWIFSGDLKQLTPYTEQDNLIASFETLPTFGSKHQGIQTVINYFSKVFENEKLGGGQKYSLIFPLPANSLNIASDFTNHSKLKIAILGTKKSDEKTHSVSFEDFKNGNICSTFVYGANIIFCNENIPIEVQKLLPKNFIFITDSNRSEKKYFYSVAQNEAAYNQRELFKLSFHNRGSNKNESITLENIYEKISSELKENNFAKEIIWRICRIAELSILSKGNSSLEKKIEGLEKGIENLLPQNENFKNSVTKEIDLLFSIALPSVLQLLQTGISKNIFKNVVKNKKVTTLNSGFEENDLKKRRVTLNFQHRMNDEIAQFSSINFYHGDALKTASDCENRPWKYQRYKNHITWLNVKGTGDNNQNQNEVHKIGNELKHFIDWAKNNPKENGNYEVAILTYYKKQERLLKSEIKQIMGVDREKNFYKDDKNHIEVKIFTVDKFQGQEADLVFLSFVKSKNASLGFMDNPNRLNVALTRARFMRVIVGDFDYFKNCKSELMKNLAGFHQNERTVIESKEY